MVKSRQGIIQNCKVILDKAQSKNAWKWKGKGKKVVNKKNKKLQNRMKKWPNHCKTGLSNTNSTENSLQKNYKIIEIKRKTKITLWELFLTYKSSMKFLKVL